MLLYEKKIVYLSQYENGIRNASAGFAEFLRERNALLLDIHIRLQAGIPDGEYALSLIIGNRDMALCNMSFKMGKASVHRGIPIQQEMMSIDRKTFPEKDLFGICLNLGGQRLIIGRLRETADISFLFQSPHSSGKSAAPPADLRKESESETAESLRLHAAEGETPPVIQPFPGKQMLEETISENKWEQLQKSYPQIHPFGDERAFLSIEPKDFVILQASYQKLVNNSFLLHGFYNYRHLILGPDKSLREEQEYSFYLGVPGTYFEREKMVAVMFGFEGFECSGPVEIGKFGYYMRRVEL